MTIKQNIHLKTSQSLALTPRLQQAINLLQLSSQELALFINTQIQENPLLEGEASELCEVSMDDCFNTSSHYDEDSIESQNTFDYESAPFSVKNSSIHDDFMGTEISEQKTLCEYLEQQLRESVHNHFEQSIGLYLIHSLNDYGFLTIPHEEVAKIFNTNTSVIQKIIKKLQAFDPPGIFAQNIEDSLRIQLEDQNDLSPEMDRLLHNINLLTSEPLEKFAKLSNITVQQCQKLILKLRKLSPYPASRFAHTPTQSLVPDVLLAKKNNTWSVEINPQTQPLVYINSDYYHNLKANITNALDKNYLNNRYSHAKWLVQSIHHRLETLTNVSKEIIHHQQDFLEKGFSAIKPLGLKHIASALGIHESTVSRISNSKYIATPYGTLPLKFFFSASVTSIYENHEAVSAKRIHEAIRQVIKNEPKHKPYPDDEIVKKLEDQGITVARRTINKYRKTLNIASASQRRRQYVIR